MELGGRLSLFEKAAHRSYTRCPPRHFPTPPLPARHGHSLSAPLWFPRPTRDVAAPARPWRKPRLARPSGPRAQFFPRLRWLNREPTGLTMCCRREPRRRANFPDGLYAWSRQSGLSFVELNIRFSRQPTEGIDFVTRVKYLNLFIEFPQSIGVHIGPVLGFRRSQHQPVRFEFEIDLVLRS